MGGSCFEARGRCSQDPILTSELDMVMYACHSTYTGNINRRTVVQANQVIIASPYSNNKGKKGEVTQVVEYLPSKCKALNSKSNTATKIYIIQMYI
jgi:hypothetical protein